MKKKVLSMVLAMLMIATLVPVSVLAENSNLAIEDVTTTLSENQNYMTEANNGDAISESAEQSNSAIEAASEDVTTSLAENSNPDTEKTSLTEGQEYAAEVTINGETTQYETLTLAWEAAKAGTETAPATVKLLTDITQTKTLELGKNIYVTLDLNDKVLTLDGDMTSGISSNNGNLSIVDKAVNKTKKYYVRDEKGLWIRTDKETDLAVEGGIITAKKNSIMTRGVNLMTVDSIVSGISFVGCTATALDASGENGEITVADTNFFGNMNLDNNTLTTFLAGNKVTVDNCRFEENYGDEGVLHYSYGSPSKYGAFSVQNCTFKNNTADFGGAMYITSLDIEDAVATIKGCTFSENKGINNGGAIYINGIVTINGCDISDNEAGNYGGGIYISSPSQVLIYDCEMDTNVAETGGGIYKASGGKDTPTEKTVLVDTTIDGNVAASLAGGIFYSAEQKQSCFVAGTLVSMADGTTKKIEEVEAGDVVKTFDHEKGEFSSAKVYLAWKGQTEPQATYKLNFEGGMTVQCVASHTFLEKTSRKYKTFTAQNAEGYVGQYFFGEDGNWHKLISVSIEEDTEWLYEIYTAGHQNSFAEGMLSAPADVSYLLNIYELDENLKADEKELNADIEKYGLADFDYAVEKYGMSRQYYEDANAKYCFVVVGKGLMTMEELEEILYSATEQPETAEPATSYAASIPFTADEDEPSIFNYDDSYIGQLTLGENVVVTGNVVDTDKSNIYLNQSSLIFLEAEHSGINAGVTLYDPGYGRFTVNGAATDKVMFFHDADTYHVLYNEKGYLELGDGYKVTETVDTHGSVSVGDYKYYLEGNTVTVEATPSTGFVLDKVYYQPKDGDLTEIKAVSGVYSFVMPAKEVTVSATFTHVHSWGYVLSKTNEENDTITAVCNNPDCTYKGTDTKLTINAPTNCTYDGTDKEADFGSATSFLGSTDLPTITYKYKATKDGLYSATTETKKAGFYLASFTVGEGDAAKTANVEFVISKKQLTISGSSASDKVYDGTTKAEAKAGTLSGVLSGEKVTVEVESANFNDKNAGKNKPVDISYKISGDDAANYEAPENDTVTANITAKPITAVADNKTMILGENVPAFTATVTGLVGTDTITYSFNTIKPEGMGVYTILPQGDKNQGNYEVTYKEGILTVNGNTNNPQANPSDVTKIYNNYKAKEEYKDKTLDVEVRTDKTVPQEDKDKISKKTGTKKVQYCNAELYLIIKESGKTSEKNIGDENDTLLSITYKFDFNNKSEIQVFRLHGDTVDEITEKPNSNGEYYTVDKQAGTITVAAKKYSTFAIAYAEAAVPASGDTNNTWLYFLIAALALGAIGTTVAVRKKTNR